MMKAEQEPEVEILDRYEGRSLAFPVFLLILAIIYDISPIDIIPDIPVVGYVDDFFITAAAVILISYLSVHSGALFPPIWGY